LAPTPLRIRAFAGTNAVTAEVLRKIYNIEKNFPE
jgi:hypothetical protein